MPQPIFLMLQNGLPPMARWKMPFGPSRPNTTESAKTPGGGTRTASSLDLPQLFAFIEHGGPPTNNHAKRSLRPLVIFQKVCMGTRSAIGSENISVFASLTQTAALHGAKVIDMFRALFRSSPNHAQDVIFGCQSQVNLSG
jgi:hypothetical protein